MNEDIKMALIMFFGLIAPIMVAALYVALPRGLHFQIH